MGLLINNVNTSPQPDSSDAFLDALLNLSGSDSDFYAGKSVLRNPDVFSAVQVISSTVASCPFISSNTPLISKMLNNPDIDGIRSGFNFWSSIITNLLINGNSFALIENGGHALRFIENNEMKVTIDTNTEQVHYYYSPNTQTTQEIAPSSILHFKILSTNGVCGISPLYALKDSLDLQATGNATLRNMFSKSIRGYLSIHKSDLNSQARSNLRDSFSKMAENGLAIGDDSISFQSIDLDPNLIKAIQSNNLASSKVASVFSIPLEMIGLENSHSSVSQSLKAVFLEGLQQYFEAISSELNCKLQGYNISQDKSNILPASFADRAKTLVSLIQNGVLTPSEARQTLNIDTDKDKDNEALNRFYGSLNYSQLDNLSENDYNKANTSKYSNDNTDSNNTDNEQEGNNDKDSK